MNMAPIYYFLAFSNYYLSCVNILCDIIKQIGKISLSESLITF